MGAAIAQTDALNVQSKPSIWNAELALGLTLTQRGTLLKSCRHQGPLYVQKPFYPEGRELAHLYLLHPPGGMVSGDTLQISADLTENAKALITTPGAGRVYRAREDRALQKQIIRFDLAENSSLEWLPLESIIYPGAITQLDTHVHLSAGAKFIGWEVTSLGLPASGEGFDALGFGQLKQCLQIYREGRLCLRERFVLEASAVNATDDDLVPAGPSMKSALSGLRDYPVNGVMIAGPFERGSGQGSDQSTAQESLIEALREICEDMEQPALAAATLNDEFLIVRYLGHCSEQGRKPFTQCWQQIRPEILGRKACEPRIWAT
jgi:urease accessory protein